MMILFIDDINDDNILVMIMTEMIFDDWWWHLVVLFIANANRWYIESDLVLIIYYEGYRSDDDDWYWCWLALPPSVYLLIFIIR